MWTSALMLEGAYVAVANHSTPFISQAPPRFWL
jgi:hypothetical protein